MLQNAGGSEQQRSGGSLSSNGEDRSSSDHDHNDQKESNREKRDEEQDTMPTGEFHNGQGLFGSAYARSFRELLRLARALSDLGYV